MAIKIGQITSSGVVHAAPKPREEENPNRAVPGVADTFDPEQGNSFIITSHCCLASSFFLKI